MLSQRDLCSEKKNIYIYPISTVMFIKIQIEMQGCFACINPCKTFSAHKKHENLF